LFAFFSVFYNFEETVLYAEKEYYQRQGHATPHFKQK